MLLALDIGNTRSDLGAFEGDELVGTWSFHTSPQMTADELAVTVAGLLGPGRSAATGLVVASVVPTVTQAVTEMAAKYHAAVPCVVVGPGVRTGVPLYVDNPREVGADRVVDALAVAELYGGPAIVVALGTATRIDAVGADGGFLGGVIAPGLLVGAEALAARAASMRLVELAAPRRVVGRNTVEALQAGILLGAAAMIDGLVARMRTELRGAGRGDFDGCPVVATGALMSLVIDECDVVSEYEPDLRLEGLRMVFDRNRG